MIPAKICLVWKKSYSLLRHSHLEIQVLNRFRSFLRKKKQRRRHAALFF